MRRESRKMTILIMIIAFMAGYIINSLITEKAQAAPGQDLQARRILEDIEDHLSEIKTQFSNSYSSSSVVGQLRAIATHLDNIEDDIDDIKSDVEDIRYDVDNF